MLRSLLPATTEGRRHRDTGNKTVQNRAVLIYLAHQVGVRLIRLRTSERDGELDRLESRAHVVIETEETTQVELALRGDADVVDL